MKQIFLATLLCPLSLLAQRTNHLSSSQSVQGSIVMPALMKLEVERTAIQELSLQNFEDFATGKVYNNYFTINVKANRPWVVSVMADNRFFSSSSALSSSTMPVSLLYLKKSEDNRFVNVTDNAQSLFYSVNNNIANRCSLDLKIDGPFDYHSSDYWTSLIFTVTQQ